MRLINLFLRKFCHRRGRVFHKSTKTLIVTDLIENFEPEKIASPIRRKIYRLARVTAPDGQTPIDYRMTF